MCCDMDSYRQAIDFLYTQLPMFSVIGPGAYKPGLGNAHALAQAFGNPHQGLRCIHVAGTNGKGSTSHSLASVLQRAGYKVGLYTSPHITDFRERIRINGEMIAEADVVDFVDRFQQMGLDCSPSFFELTTIMAFEYFKRQQVDLAVIEVGLGGRLDTTNIIKPELCVITNVSLDHTALLGNTLEAIAGEKAGIIKDGVPVVVGETTPETRQVYSNVATSKRAPIIFAEDHPMQIAECDLQGEWQKKNVNTVLHALQELRSRGIADISEQAIADGMAHVQLYTGLRGRWMQISDNPTVICDSGHNIGAWQYIGPRLQEISKKQCLRVVIGFADDKDVASILQLVPRDAIYYLVSPQVKRGLKVKALAEIALRNGLNCKSYDSVKAGYEAALADASPGDCVYVGGSNYVLAEML